MKSDNRSNAPTYVCAVGFFGGARSQYGITREECDEYAIHSQTLWSSGHAAGAFKEEMAPIDVKTKKGPKVSLGVFNRDDLPGPLSRSSRHRILRSVLRSLQALSMLLRMQIDSFQRQFTLHASKG